MRACGAGVRRPGHLLRPALTTTLATQGRQINDEVAGATSGGGQLDAHGFQTRNAAAGRLPRQPGRRARRACDKAAGTMVPRRASISTSTWSTRSGTPRWLGRGAARVCASGTRTARPPPIRPAARQGICRRRGRGSAAGPRGGAGGCVRRDKYILDPESAKRRATSDVWRLRLPAPRTAPSRLATRLAAVGRTAIRSARGVGTGVVLDGDRPAARAGLSCGWAASRSDHQVCHRQRPEPDPAVGVRHRAGWAWQRNAPRLEADARDDERMLGATRP